MKVLNLSTYNRGGAAIAARRIHRHLLKAGVDSWFASGDRPAEGARSLCLAYGEASFSQKVQDYAAFRYASLAKRSWHAKSFFSYSLAPSYRNLQIESTDPDVIHLNWVASDFLSIKELGSLPRPVVWTMHDVWAMTGGCHYPGGCDRFESGCQSCPQLSPTHQIGSFLVRDPVARVFSEKLRCWPGSFDAVVVASEWMKTQLERSPLFRGVRVELIRYGLDTEVFRPLDSSYARACFSLPADRTLLLVGADALDYDTRKGFHILKEALRLLSPDLCQSFDLVVFGTEAIQDLPVRSHSIGSISDEVALPLVYSSCDGIIIPSLEDNFPNMGYESAACGIPAIVSNAGGVPELISEGGAGHIFESANPQALANALSTFLMEDSTRRKLKVDARASALKRFSGQRQGEAYAALFQDLLTRKRPQS